MLRVVAFRKAILAGAAGAIAWEIAVGLLALAGIPVFDLVRELGTLPFPNSGPVAWLPAGLGAHAVVGAAWALFYAYFFWARFRWPPPLQGLVFAALPAVLAVFIVIPQLELMHLHQEMVQLDWRSFLHGLDQAKLGGILLGHALFGLTVGAIYTHPVGYPTAEVRTAPRARMVRRK
ncbi:MAG TPA: hypothetical protein VF776_04210, partial [Sphingomicrobium sp.]